MSTTITTTVVTQEQEEEADGRTAMMSSLLARVHEDMTNQQTRERDYVLVPAEELPGLSEWLRSNPPFERFVVVGQGEGEGEKEEEEKVKREQEEDKSLAEQMEEARRKRAYRWSEEQLHKNATTTTTEPQAQQEEGKPKQQKSPSEENDAEEEEGEEEEEEEEEEWVWIEKSQLVEQEDATQHPLERSSFFANWPSFGVTNKLGVVLRATGTAFFFGFLLGGRFALEGIYRLLQNWTLATGAGFMASMAVALSPRILLTAVQWVVVGGVLSGGLMAVPVLVVGSGGVFVAAGVYHAFVAARRGVSRALSSGLTSSSSSVSGSSSSPADYTPPSSPPCKASSGEEEEENKEKRVNKCNKR
ncbi:hypothetical protein QOT17_011934 [Balamuthia mandrillaris]